MTAPCRIIGGGILGLLACELRRTEMRRGSALLAIVSLLR